MTNADWQAMKRHVPELADLEAEARAAGRTGQTWWDTWGRLYEPLSKLVGPGSCGRFRSAHDFERARKELCWAWGIDPDAAVVPPWEAEGETVPLAPAFVQEHGQRSFLDPSPEYE